MKRFWEKISAGDVRSIISVLSIVGAFVVICLLIFKPIPAENKDTLNLTVGVVLGGLIGGVNGYYFGASKKDDNKPTPL